MLQETVLVVKDKCFSSSSSFPVLNLPPPSCRLNHFQHLGLDLGLHLLLASVEVSFKENKQFMRFLKKMFVHFESQISCRVMKPTALPPLRNKSS